MCEIVYVEFYSICCVGLRVELEVCPDIYNIVDHSIIIRIGKIERTMSVWTCYMWFIYYTDVSIRACILFLERYYVFF